MVLAGFYAIRMGEPCAWLKVRGVFVRKMVKVFMSLHHFSYKYPEKCGHKP